MMTFPPPRRIVLGGLLGGALLGAGCVTINIYFPAAAAEKAADRIIDEVWQLKRGDASAPAPAPASGAKPDAK
jgi:hypothetical protein